MLIPNKSFKVLLNRRRYCSILTVLFFNSGRSLGDGIFFFVKDRPVSIAIDNKGGFDFSYKVTD